MALGKKSFLIRDILETSRHQQQQQQPAPELNDIPITLQNNPKLLELIFRNRMETLDDHNLITQETNESPTNSSSGDSNELEHNVPKTISPSSIMNHHWLSNDRPLLFSADRSANNHYGLNEHEKFNHSIQSLTPQLYQNLYYYAIQQQINASMVNNFNIGESSGNVLDQLPIESSITIGTQSIAKVLKVKSGIKRESKRKTNEFKVKRSKCRKKMKSLELNIDDPSMVQPEHSKSDWQSEDVECNCEETDDLDNGNPHCAAQSKCRKLRRNRTVFTELQLMGLERRFDSQKYLSTPDR
ncbi:hypothetical protein RDWZM_002100 [Blomia tropicalis]|uniref:Homeobox domain-containing protein n=1 Tax=Blomia tropicalis TaxID=40697 RepID=A0A9Q0RRD8_BLOTA|nr:hypothetical protein RDWZM_002100 [Blomia tropicalis]